MGKLHSILFNASLPDKLFNDYLDVVAGNRWKFIFDVGDGWRTAFRYEKKGDQNSDKKYYPCSDVQIAKHLTEEGKSEGKASTFCSIGLRAPKEITHFDIDLDGERPHKWGHIDRMRDIVSFFGDYYYEKFNKQADNVLIALFRKSSANLSVLGRCKSISPYKMIASLSYLIESEIGEFKIEDGICELFPRRDKARRLPFGHDQTIITRNMVNLSKSKGEDLQVFLELPAFDLVEMAEDFNVKWTGYRKSKLRTHDTIHAATDFNLVANMQYSHGLTMPSTRYHTETNLILYFWKMGFSIEETFLKIKEWYEDGKTNGLSKDWALNKEKTLRDLRLHIKSYYEWLEARSCVPLGEEDAVDESALLSFQDVMFIFQTAETDLRYGEWLFDLMLYAKKRPAFQKRLFLSRETMRREFKNGEERYKSYLDRTISAGLLTLEGNHGCFVGHLGSFRRPKVFALHYEFPSETLLPNGMHYREALVNTYSPEQIRQWFPKSTAWRLNKLRK